MTNNMKLLLAVSISSVWVLSVTAADCGVPGIAPKVKLNGSSVENLVVGGEESVPHRHGNPSPSGYTVKLGAHKKGFGPWVTQGESSMQQIRKVTEIHVHPKYDHSAHDYDISLLKLAKPVDITKFVSPICLPKKEDAPKAGESVVVTGWGTLHEGGLFESPTLQQVVVPVVGQSECQKDYEGVDTIDETMICAGYKQGGEDSCQGDSGGPLMSYHRNTWILEGIVSFGKGCAEKGYPGVYGRVSEFMDFVTEKTGLTFDN